jgi:methionyl-tRNA formyltransferase
MRQSSAGKTAKSIGKDLPWKSMTPRPGAYTSILMRNAKVTLKIHRAELCEVDGGQAGTVVAAEDDGIVVAAGEGGIVLKEVQIAGGKRLKVPDFLRGHPIPTGTQLAPEE